jgi:hypothetical protein
MMLGVEIVNQEQVNIGGQKIKTGGRLKGKGKGRK